MSASTHNTSPHSTRRRTTEKILSRGRYDRDFLARHLSFGNEETERKFFETLDAIERERGEDGATEQ